MPGARTRQLEKKLLDLEACIQSLGAKLEQHIQDSTATSGSPVPTCRANDDILPAASAQNGLSNWATADSAPSPNLSRDDTDLQALSSHQLSLMTTNQRPLTLDHLVGTNLGMEPSLTATNPNISKAPDAHDIDSLPADLLISLTDLYFKHINPWCPILGRERTFEKLFGSGAGDPSQRLLLHAIVASSLPLSDDYRLTLEFRAHIQQTACKEIHHRAFTHVDVVALQSLLIISLAFLDGPDGRPALAGITLVARTVVQLGWGLARNSPDEAPPLRQKVGWGVLPSARGWAEEEERRRLFWMAYVVDRYAATIWETPPNIELDDINTQLPCSYDLFVGDRYVTTKEFRSGVPILSSTPTGMNLGSFSYHCDLLRIMTRVQHFLDQPLNLRSPAEVEEWHASLWQLDTELRTWIDELPSEHGSISRLCHWDPGSRISNWVVLHGAIITVIIRLHSPAACPSTPSASFPPSEEATKRCLSAVDSARCIIQNDVSPDMLKLLGPFFATCLWVCCRFLIIYNAHHGNDIFSELEPFLTTLDGLGDTWQVAKGYSRVIRRICSDMTQLQQSTDPIMQGTWKASEDVHPVTSMRKHIRSMRFPDVRSSLPRNPTTNLPFPIDLDYLYFFSFFDYPKAMEPN